MKKIAVSTLLMFIFCAPAGAQNTFLKWNAAYWIFGIVNMSVETALGDKVTLNADVVYSPWKSVQGNNFHFMQFIPEIRYYPWGKFNKLYVGGYAAHHRFFRLTKWNYINHHRYQKGNGFALGAVIGYQTSISPRWNLDVYAGGGWQHSGYRGYSSTGEMYVEWNRSAEWMPYKMGIAFSYKLRAGL